MLHMSGAPGALLGSFMTLRLPMCIKGTEVYTIVSNGLRLTIERKASLANSKSHNKVLLYAVILKGAVLLFLLPIRSNSEHPKRLDWC